LLLGIFSLETQLNPTHHFPNIMIFDSIQSKLFWTVLLYYFSVTLGVAFRREANGHAQIFFQIKQGA
jgi:hypothetical protein